MPLFAAISARRRHRRVRGFTILCNNALRVSRHHPRHAFSFSLPSCFLPIPSSPPTLLTLLSLSPCCTPNPSRASCPCPQKPSPGDRYYCYRYRSNRARSGFSSHTSHSRYRCGQLLLTTTATVLRRYIAIAKTPTETQYASNRTRYSGFSLRPFLRVRGLSPFFPIFLFSYLLCLSRFVFLCFGRGIRAFRR